MLSCGCKNARDLGWPLDEDNPMWPTVCAPMRQIIKTPETSQPPGARGKQAFELNGGSGTHIDAPAHFVPGGRTIDLLRPEELLGVPLAIVDVEAACERDADHAVSRAELEADEAQHGQIQAGSLVCVRTGWAKRFLEGCQEVARRRAQGAASTGVHTRYHNVTSEEDLHPQYKQPRMHFPGLAADAATWLVQERSVAGLGIDTLSPDPGAAEGFAVHNIVLGADKYILENLNLEGVPARGAAALVAPTNLKGAPEAPVRVFALLPEEEAA